MTIYQKIWREEHTAFLNTMGEVSVRNYGKILSDNLCERIGDMRSEVTDMLNIEPNAYTPEGFPIEKKRFFLSVEIKNLQRVGMISGVRRIKYLMKTPESIDLAGVIINSLRHQRVRKYGTKNEL